ncbi:DUF736 domain-containing protein [Zavarzinia sp.]|uniref:DUF736 domain-containing protein n=1 Tax=Zavarzinia sp. TaxID=2027920 RepID=UPI003BB58C1F
MPQIGEFTRTETGFTGRIRSLAFDIDVVLVPVEHAEAGASPAFRIHLDQADGPEIGAAWKRTGERAGDFLALQIDDPVFVQPIRANLFQAGADGTAWSLHWSRPSKPADKA